MKIEAIEAGVHALPIPNAPWTDSIHHVTHIELVVVDVITDGGVRGVGVSHSSGVGARAILSLVLDEISPQVVGQEISPRGLWQKSWNHIRDLGGGGATTMALGALDLAYWDALGKALNRPVVDLLGRCHEAMPVYASGINLNLTLDELLGQVEGWMVRGYRGFKVKVGKPDIEEDVERLTAVRRLIGRQPLMVDANQGWDGGKALRAIRSFEHLNLTWVEEPLPAEDIAGHARLRRSIGTPVAIGENVYTLQRFADYISSGAVDYIQADVVRVGGLTPYLDIAALARAWNLPMAPHFMLEISAQALCAIPNSYILEDIDGGSLSDLGALAEPFLLSDGYYRPPTRPGLGLELDREYLERHRTDVSGHPSQP